MNKATEIVLPPLFLLLLGSFVMILLRRCSRNKVPRGKFKRPDTPSSDYESSCLKDTLRHNCMRVNPVQYTKKWEMEFGPQNLIDEFLSPSDIDVYRNLYNFHNSAKELLIISLPAVVSLLLCPITLLVHENITGYFWPNRTQPAVNEAVACFLAPSGMVYAVSFGFAFQQVLDKLNGIKTKLNVELNEIEELIILTKRLKNIPNHCKAKIFITVKNEIICIIKYLAKMNGYQQIGLENDGDIWSVVSELREGKVQHQVDVAIINKIINYLGSLNNICDKMRIMHSKMHLLQWGFLETVSYFSFFGVQMVKAESERLELTMCLLTTFSITMLCFIVADIDNPFHGFFRIDLTVIGDILILLEDAYFAQIHIDSSIQQLTKKETPEKQNISLR